MAAHVPVFPPWQHAQHHEFGARGPGGGPAPRVQKKLCSQKRAPPRPFFPPRPPRTPPGVGPRRPHPRPPPRQSVQSHPKSPPPPPLAQIVHLRAATPRANPV